MLNQETKRKIDSCRDMLVGKLPDPKAQIEQITYALIYKFMGDMDKASVALGGKASFFVNGYEQYAWDKLMATNIGGKQRLDLYSEAIAKLSLNSHLPQLFRDIFKDAFLPYRDPETLNMFLKEINWFTYTHSEDLGDAFEYLLSVMSSQGDAGQFRTPRHIIDFIVSVVDPKKDETVLDPACGTAGFLISTYKHILQQNAGENPGDKLTPDEKTALMNQMVGYDISPDMVRLSLVNMYLHGFPEPHICEHDTLTDEGRWEDSFDVIMANPPFMSPKGGIRPHKRFSIQANRSEVLFVDYIAEHLNPTGRAGVIVPEGIIFQSGNAYKGLRKMLVDNYLFCVVSLPSGVFNPYSGVKTSILMMDKTLAKQTENILFVKIENDGFDLGAQRREIAGSDFPQALTNVNNFVQSVRNGKEFFIPESPNILVVSKRQLAENGDYNLSMERYKTQELRQIKWPVVELGELITLEYGKPLKNEDRVHGPYPVFGSNGIVGWHNKFIVEGPFIVVGRKGSAGSVTYSELNGFPIDTALYVQIKNKEMLNLKYLYYQLLQLNLDKVNIQSGVPGLNRNDAYIKQIPLPPLNTQQEIVSEIESYQKIIDGARQVVENYKAQIKIDPQWPLVTIEDLASKEKNSLKAGPFGSSLKKECYVKSGYKIYGQEQVIRGDVSYGDYYISEEKFGELKSCEVKAGDILISLVGTYGKILIIPEKYESGIINPRLVKVTLDKEKILPAYFVEAFRQEAVVKQVANLSYGGTMGILSLKVLKSLKLPVPPIGKQKSIIVQIEKEQQLVNASKELIQIYEQKIKDKIAAVWEP